MNNLKFIEKDKEIKNIKVIEKNLRELLLRRNLEIYKNDSLKKEEKEILQQQFLLIRDVFKVLRKFKKEVNYEE